MGVVKRNMKRKGLQTKKSAVSCLKGDVWWKRIRVLLTVLATMYRGLYVLGKTLWASRCQPPLSRLGQVYVSPTTLYGASRCQPFFCFEYE